MSIEPINVMKMKSTRKLSLTFIFSLFIAFNAISQGDSDLELAATNLFTQLTKSGTQVHVPLLRVGQYRNLIKRQGWSDENETLAIYQIDKSYSTSYVAWERSISNVQREYRAEQISGATFSYLYSNYYPDEDLKDVIHVESSYLYKLNGIQNEVIITYKLGWVPTYGYHLMSEVESDF